MSLLSTKANYYETVGDRHLNDGQFITKRRSSLIGLCIVFVFAFFIASICFYICYLNPSEPDLGPISFSVQIEERNTRQNVAGTYFEFKSSDKSFDFVIPDGHVILTEVPLGNYVYTITHDRFLVTSGSIIITHSDANSLKVFFLDYKQSEFKGSVTEFITNSAVVGSIVEVACPGTESVQESDNDGNFYFPNIFRAICQVTITTSGFQTISEKIDFNSEVVENSFQVSPNPPYLHVRVVYVLDKEPLPGAIVNIQGDDFFENFPVNDDGRILATNVKAGLYKVYAEKKGYYPTSQQLEVKASEETFVELMLCIL
ncbi:hypothetical protein RCL1_007001 [Eukaryota sp. TZLM3-RCL]